MTATDDTATLPLNLHEYEAAARAVLPPMVWHYVSGGSGDEMTLRANRAAFDRWRFLPRMLRWLHQVSTATSVLGQAITLPVLIAPSGRQRLCHDAGERAVECGARAILVSNHGGRQLDSAVAALDALPAVVDAVAGRVEVLVDGGVRRGTDVLKALALGARAVLIGRPIHWGLAVGGEEGVWIKRWEVAMPLVHRR